MPVTQIKKGQNWTLDAVYDYDTHPGMLDYDGKQSDVMGIALMLVRRRTQRAVL
jgi:hypothetical protein